MNNDITISMIKEAEKQIDSQQAKIDYDIRDYPISFIVQNFKIEEYFIPEYQRAYVWPEQYKSRFIESLLLNLPIPLIFLSDTKEGKLEIVDGVQRISTLFSFMEGEFILEGLKTLTKINGFSVNDLPPAQYRRLTNKSLRVIVLGVNTEEEVRKEVFDRLNTSSLKANDSEVRKGKYQGEFFDFLKTLIDVPLFNKVAPTSEKHQLRQEPLELVLRFFAYSYNYENFSHNVKEFIDVYVESTLDNFDKEQMTYDFISMLEFAGKHFPIGFKKSINAKTTPRVRFEALSVGIYCALKINPELIPSDVTQWLESDEFKVLTTSDGSNSRIRVKARIEFVRDKLLGE